MTQDPGCVVVGAGLAAAHAISTLRQHGYPGPITLLGDEQEIPYERPALSKGYLQGRTAAGQLYVHDSGWYAAHQVETRLGDRATAIDRDGRRVRLESGDQLPYRHLLLATGSRPRTLDIPGARLPGVHALRTLADSDILREALSRDQRWVIIGAGWIGLEVAAAARAAGRDVTVLEHAALPLQHVLGDRLARHFARLHRAHGVDLRTGVSVRAIEPSAGGLAVRVEDGSIPADVVVMAVGVIPNSEIAAEAGLDTDSGIVVDEHLRTGDPGILAAGDVAAAHNTALGKRLRVEHWDNAIRQGQLAARTVLGLPSRYDWQPYFYTDQYDLGMEYVGQHGPTDRLVLRGDIEGGAFLAFWLDEERVTAAMNVNIWDVNNDLRTLVGRTVPAERLADAGIPLPDLAPRARQQAPTPT
jgi:3-phenylpropionate/trans-cinnamate dioxygenase ferredoxin reductase subunit